MKLFVCNKHEGMNMRRIIAAAIVKENKILIAKRKYGSLAGYWEFPGGKVEDNESDKECLTREIAEEFAVSIRVEAYLGEERFFVKDNEYVMALYRAIPRDESFSLTVHSEIIWVEKEQLQRYKLAPVDRMLVQKGCLEEII